MPFPPLGTHKDELDTPALCIDLDAFEANVAEAIALCRKHGVAWRPHAKCHKSPDIARRLLEAGAIGLTCAKLGEAEVFAAAGVPDLLVANLIVGPRKIERLVELRRKANPIICLDHIEQATPISLAMQEAGLRVRALLEIDIGLHRVGVEPGKPAVELARLVSELPGIELVGIMGYEGHLLLVEDQKEKAAKIKAALGLLGDTRRAMEKAGLPCPIVSCGGTGSLPFAVKQSGVTEIQAGGVIFMDAFYRHQCRIEQFQYALFLIATVVSRPAPERAIIDAGRKTLNTEVIPPRVRAHQDAPGGLRGATADGLRGDIEVKRLSAEHGELLLAPSAQNLKIGNRLEIIPGYGDLTTVLHNKFYVLQNDRLVDIWPLAARGRLE